MECFHVNQSKSYNKDNKFIWAPTRTKGNKVSKGYEILKELKEGDLIFHYFNKGIKAISKVQKKYEESPPPKKEEYKIWEEASNGYLVQLEYIITFDTSIPFTQEQTKWLEKKHNDPSYDDSPYDKNGSVKQGVYVSKLNTDYVRYIITYLLSKENDENRRVLEEIINTYDDNYEFYISEINDDIYLNDFGNEEFEIGPERKNIQKSNNNKITQQRSPKKAREALRKAEYKCEFSPDDKLFIRNGSDKYYTEPHHLIPLSKYNDFNYSLDVVPNIVSLCSHCHNLLHYGRYEDKEPIIKKLYEKREEELRKCELDISLEKLLEYYK